MGKLIFLLTIFAITACNTQSKEVVRACDTFTNPIISGFNPDPSICRVKDDYYLVTSTFEYFPGVPIYHSKDLVNWKQIGNVLHRPSQLNLDGLECSQGIFAPCIRYNKGVFYMVTTLVGQRPGGDFIVTATNPAGPWSDPHWIDGATGIDPDLFFDDDGKVYMSGTFKPEEPAFYKHNNIWVQELDVENWELVGERKTLVDGADFVNDDNPIRGDSEAHLYAIEAPHLYKKDGWYYSTFSHGGTGYNHAFSIFRSKHIFGPYEGNPNNPILTHRDYPRYSYIMATGHADLFTYGNNNWGIVYLIKRQFKEDTFKSNRYILGRETALSLIDWSGDWPIVNPKGKITRCEVEQACPNLPLHTFDNKHWEDDFESTTLHPQWTFIRTPRSEWWSLSNKKGSLSIDLRPEMLHQKVNPSFIGKRQEHAKFSVSAQMEFTPRNTSEEAGIVIHRERNSYLKYTLAKVDDKTILRAVVRCSNMQNDSLIAQLPISASELLLKVTGQNFEYAFEYSVNDGKNWLTLKDAVDLTETKYIYSARFTGPFVGMYASSNGKESSNDALFDWFKYSEF